MRLETNYSTVEWSADGALVTKTRPRRSELRRRFDNEIRVNRMLSADRPPVPAPRLVSADRKERSLTFEAVAGEPLGPKYPTALDAGAIDVMVGIADRL